jgi:crotonobetainyl-CoA:carnitine CoA-transferase CaiB-like acyl-CoA transferase
MFLGDWGAEVIKIEWWHRMDAWRGMISIEHDVDGQQAYNKKPNWLVLNRN